MENLKIVLLQLLPENTLERNLQKGLQYCKKAKDMGANQHRILYMICDYSAIEW